MSPAAVVVPILWGGRVYAADHTLDSSVPGRLGAIAISLAWVAVAAIAWGQGSLPARGQGDAPPGAQPLTPSTPLGSERQIVAGVEILGVPPQRQQEVQKHLHSRKDREFDPETVQGDVRRLHASGLFREVKTFTRQTDGGIVLIYQVFERPRIRSVKHLGNRGIPEKKLNKEHGLKRGDPLSAFATENGRRVIEELYHRSGFPKATVSILEGNQPGDQNVIFVINEGQLQRISKVEFEGNTIVGDDRLETQIDSRPGYFWYFFRGKVDREKIDHDVQKLTAYYRSLGYFSARIGRELVFDDSAKWLTIKFIIDEGPRYTVRNVVIDGVTKFRPEPLLGFLKLKRGQKYNQEDMNRDVNLLVDLYGSQGYVFADIQPDLRFHLEPGELDLVYHVKEGDVFHVGNINVHIKGDFPHTRETVILNRLSLRHGDLIDMRKVKEDERRLMRSQVFITSLADGEPPRIVVKPPSLDSIRSLAARRSPEMTVRAQNPEEAAPPAAAAHSSLPPAAEPSIYAQFDTEPPPPARMLPATLTMPPR
jgi:outer membrane protein insertion porin family